jgi:hypothetical protein
MNEMRNTNTCERVDDLIGFLYGELGESEARRFEHHLSECAACEAEFAAFGQIRESILDWRNESLGLGRSPAVAGSQVLAPVAAEPRMHAKQSAIAALREFFTLSPLWMKGATAFAALLFCVCAVLAVAYVKGRQYSAGGLANANSNRGYTKEYVDAQVAQAIERTRAEDAANQRKYEAAADRTSTPKSVNYPAKAPRPAEVSARNPRRPFTRQERQELAADLRLVGSKDDDDLDLSTDSNRPAP